MNGRFARAASRTVLLATLVTGIASADAPLDVAALDRWWDFEQPAASEAKFRAELAQLSTDSGACLELMTQIARAQGLRRQFDQANATLDQVEASLAGHAPRISVRYLLERGRVFNSSRQPEHAVPLLHGPSFAADNPARLERLHCLGAAP